MNNFFILSTQVVPEGRVFGLDLQTVISAGLQLFNGIVLAIALTYILYKPVKKFMEERSNRIQGNIEEAEVTMEKATNLIAEYETKIKEIDKERVEILEATRLEAAEESKKILAEAKVKADELKERSLEAVTADKKRLAEESRLHIIELSSLIAERYVAKNMDDPAQNKYLEDMLAELGETSWPS